MWDTPVDDETVAALERLGRHVRAARRQAALSQRQVEAMTGIDQTTIVRIEHGKATGLPLRRFAVLMVALDAGVATRRPALAFGLPAPGSREWINDGPAWDAAIGEDHPRTTSSPDPSV
jgi:transcriptional regulator with XRE-family HTH domain